MYTKSDKITPELNQSQHEKRYESSIIYQTMPLPQPFVSLVAV